MGEEVEPRRSELMGKIESMEKDGDADMEAMTGDEETGENEDSMEEMDERASRPDHS